ncbi:MAG TPA: hypothetical protein VHD15_08285 [Hyphomicrobiales bacterium]|nr:hypothetical protein [Hyphomicrobiales bacterium]
MLIASRNLTFRQGGRTIPVEIRINLPIQQARNDWSCHYEIDWPEGTERMVAGGFDSIQALYIALQMIGADLYTSACHKAGQLVFYKPGDGYGFPVPEGLRDLLVGMDAKY